VWEQTNACVPQGGGADTAINPSVLEAAVIRAFVSGQTSAHVNKDLRDPTVGKESAPRRAKMEELAENPANVSAPNYSTDKLVKKIKRQEKGNLNVARWIL